MSSTEECKLISRLQAGGYCENFVGAGPNLRKSESETAPYLFLSKESVLTLWSFTPNASGQLITEN